MSSTGNWDVKVFDSHLKKGCCQACCLRLMGEKNPDIYNVTEHLKNKEILVKDDDSENHKFKVKKGNPCIGCLGLLPKPFADDVAEKILSEIEQFHCDRPTFNIALVFPVSMQLRAHSHPHTRAINVGVKDVWKWSIYP